MVWLYAGGVSLLLPDVQFGMVSLDYVTYLIFVMCTQSHSKAQKVVRPPVAELVKKHAKL